MGAFPYILHVIYADECTPNRTPAEPSIWRTLDLLHNSGKFLSVQDLRQDYVFRRKPMPCKDLMSKLALIVKKVDWAEPLGLSFPLPDLSRSTRANAWDSISQYRIRSC